ncbi:MAG: hypothetical protein A2W91_14145 [Bacteroidetes bacterium GWF2_38_335]|nr:MAG: hypothetical protein A2W91_14145 [Bacteroidetes bacterium GWF2_38_335]OFY79396.1 MAG: hypothetical protein A2281_17010 [Bacteroidetes bacterium RIFOXYA12_FULL_38_20]HBS85660.1 hypothetical protein [Bacteroidales bacterium]
MKFGDKDKVLQNEKQYVFYGNFQLPQLLFSFTTVSVLSFVLICEFSRESFFRFFFLPQVDSPPHEIRAKNDITVSTTKIFLVMEI